MCLAMPLHHTTDISRGSQATGRAAPTTPTRGLSKSARLRPLCSSCVVLSPRRAAYCRAQPTHARASPCVWVVWVRWARVVLTAPTAFAVARGLSCPTGCYTGGRTPCALVPHTCACCSCCPVGFSVRARRHCACACPPECVLVCPQSAAVCRCTELRSAAAPDSGAGGSHDDAKPRLGAAATDLPCILQEGAPWGVLGVCWWSVCLSAVL